MPSRRRAFKQAACPRQDAENAGPQFIIELIKGQRNRKIMAEESSALRKAFDNIDEVMAFRMGGLLF